jgi:nucleoside-diphosphate-sugar epimerase
MVVFAAGRWNECSYGVLNPLDDRSCYPESKRAAETLLKSYYLQYGVNFNTIRIAHSYGTTMKLENFTVLFHGEPAMAYNLANETESISIKDLAHMMATLREDKKIKVVVSEGGQKGYCTYRRTALDTSAIEQLGWKPQISLKEGINRVLRTAAM